MSEPFIEVGLVLDGSSATLRLEGDYVDLEGTVIPAGEHRVEVSGAGLRWGETEATGLEWWPAEFERCQFALEAIIGVDFHWQRPEWQTFAGGLKVIAKGGRLSVINEVPLETYLASVICSEMSATSPAELVKAHSVVSRSWLLAQRVARESGQAPRPPPAHGEELIRWYDREGHANFDVCADDHCQRYHGTGRIQTGTAFDAIGVTRGQVLSHAGEVCDARYAKACGGITEDFRAAWSDQQEIPYLVPFVDGPGGTMPDPPLTDETAFRAFVESRPDAYCNCVDDAILDQVLTSFDRETRDFFRWQVRLGAEEASRLVEEKLGLGLGRILALEPVERGLSGRLVRLRLVGEGGSRVIGKELEIRRALSASHLYSSAFVVDTEGPAGRPEAFVLTGAGWGHGVGLCQIGAAVMASRGIGYEEILRHYYPGASLDRLYE